MNNGTIKKQKNNKSFQFQFLMIFVIICFSYGCNLVLIKYLAGQFGELSLGAHLSSYLGFKFIFYFRDMAYLDDTYMYPYDILFLSWSLLLLLIVIIDNVIMQL